MAGGQSESGVGAASPGWSAVVRDSGARQGTVRRHNLSLVLRTVVEAARPPSRADLAAATGLAKGTVTALVDSLIEARLIEERDPVGSSRVGRPAVPLAPARNTFAGLGMEVTADYLGVRAVDLAGGLLAHSVVDVDLRASDPTTALAALSTAVREVTTVLEADGCRIAGACLALPGLVDRPAGPVRTAPSIGWEDVDVVAELRAVGLGERYPLVVANEANLAGLAEASSSGGRRRTDATFLYVSGEVGIGAAVVIDGRVLEGAHGWSGEIGHMSVDRAGPPCGCGRRGCLEQYAGLEAMWRASGLPGPSDRDRLLGAVESGDRRALRAVRTAGQALGQVMADLLNLLDLPSIVLGGLLGQLTPYLRPPMMDALRAGMLGARWTTLSVRESRLGQWAAMTGAAWEALDVVVSDPTRWVETSSAGS